MIPLVYSAGYSGVVFITLPSLPLPSPPLPSPPLPGASAMMNESKESLLLKLCSVYVHHIRVLLCV